MKYRSELIVSLMVVALVMAAGSAAAQWRGSDSDGRHWGVERTAAAAALEGVGAVDAWGRVMVTDLVDEEQVERVVSVRLIGLDPESEYTVSADGVEIASVLTDLAGDAWVRLHSRDDRFSPPPVELPPAAELMVAQVVDSSLAPVLEGSFVIVTHGGQGFDGLSYVERIRLEVTDGTVARGIARVARSRDDVQLFETRACGLEADGVYNVVVDGFHAAVATADAVGQASVVLATDGEADALPVDLQPIEDLRLVQWSTAAGDLVLSGSFTGENMAGYGGGHGVGGDDGEGGDGEGGNAGDGHGGDNGEGGDGDGDGNGEGGHGGDNDEGGQGGGSGGGGGCP